MHMGIRSKDMIDQYIERLVARDGEGGLDRLEQDIWHRESAVRTVQVANRRLATWQALVLSVSVLGAGMVGVTAAHAVPPPSTSWFGASAKLSPASLLLEAKL